MSKLTLEALKLGATELLTREQLKNFVGGTPIKQPFAWLCTNANGSYEFEDQIMADDWAAFWNADGVPTTCQAMEQV